MKEVKIVIIGGGTAGITVAAQLIRKSKALKIVLIEPSEYHYYQPLYTLVGAGADRKEKTQRPMADLIPKGVKWIRDWVETILPSENRVICRSNQTIDYDFLVVAPGLKMDWHKVEGLSETLGKNGVCSIYGYEQAGQTWETLNRFKGGKAIFTAPRTPVKCGGAPQKIAYLSDALFRKKRMRERSTVTFATGARKLFAVKGYAESLEQMVKDRQIETLFNHELIKVDGSKKQATFLVKTYQNRQLVTSKEQTLEFDFLHVVPPQSAPDFIQKSVVSIQEGKGKGWVDVNINTLQHLRFPNIFALGDVANLPTGKTGAAVRKQAPVLVEHLMNMIEDHKAEALQQYDGYSACPILTDYNHVVMAEFTYGYQPKPSISFIDTTKPSFLMYLAKHYYLPWFYWNRMLKGKG